MTRRSAAAWAVAAVGAVLACVLLSLDDLQGPAVLVGLVPVVLVLATGWVGGAWAGAVATIGAYGGAGIYLGITHPSTGICFFDCDGIPVTFGNTAGPVWFLGLMFAGVAIFGAAMRTRYWRAALLVVGLLLTLLGFGFIALAPERWHEAEGIVVPVAFVWVCVLLGLELQRLRRAQVTSRAPARLRRGARGGSPP